VACGETEILIMTTFVDRPPILGRSSETLQRSMDCDSKVDLEP